MINIRDGSNFITRDKDGKIIGVLGGRICFGAFNSAEGQRALEGAVTIEAYFKHNCTRKSSEVFVNQLYDSGLLPHDVIIEHITEPVSPKRGTKTFFTELFKHNDRVVKVTFPLTTMSLQKVFFCFACLRTLQNEPKFVYLMRRFVHVEIDILQKLAMAAFFEYTWTNEKANATQMGSYPYHRFLWRHHNKALLTLEQFYKKLDEKYKPMGGLPFSIRLSNSWQHDGYQGWFADKSSERIPEYKHITDKVVESFLTKVKGRK